MIYVTGLSITRTPTAKVGFLASFFDAENRNCYFGLGGHILFQTHGIQRLKKSGCQWILRGAYRPPLAP